MACGNYYNEIEPRKAAWLRELIREKVIADGEVDERSITEIQPQDIAGFAQCHFFAGIGVWSYALRLAGWADDRPVWTGSCPCPSFSAAGKGGGFADPRHLWPYWARLIRECNPATVFGEQVDDAIGYGWLDIVQTDLERQNYAIGKAVLGACSVGAPHIRQRLYFVAKSLHAKRWTHDEHRQNGCVGENGGREEAYGVSGTCGEVRNLDISNLRGREARKSSATTNRYGSATLAAGADGGLGNPEIERLERFPRDEQNRNQSRWFAEGQNGSDSDASYVNRFWRDTDWILRKRWNRDGEEWCPTQPGTFPLAYGTTNRVLKLRGYGDVIVPQVAAEFIKSYLECRPADILQPPTAL